VSRKGIEPTARPMRPPQSDDSRVAQGLPTADRLLSRQWWAYLEFTRMNVDHPPQSDRGPSGILGCECCAPKSLGFRPARTSNSRLLIFILGVTLKGLLLEQASNTWPVRGNPIL
jgi:hypothetical protein